jgi:hypothetical protein
VRFRSTAAVALIFATSVAAVGVTQPRLARIARQVKERDDVYPLPPPAELHIAALGWDAALVDLLWAKLLVEYGMHWSERRDFLQAPLYVDAILELEPTYVPVYRIVGTLLAYRPMLGTESDVRKARAYLERGLSALPDDARLWTEYGQFLAFIAPSFLRDPGEMALWRKTGAQAMGHAVELGADPDVALAAAGVLSQSSSAKDAIPFLERAYEFTQHPAMAEVHEAIGRRLAALEAVVLRDAADKAARTINARWTREMPGFERDLYLLLGPVVDPARCAGLEASDTPECARDWPQALEGVGGAGGNE